MNGTTDATDRTRILGFLTRIDRRLRVNDGLEAFTLGLWGLSAFLVVAKITGLWDGPAARPSLLAVSIVTLLAWILWSSVRRKGLGASAGFADERADLKDALKSALSFLGLSERSRWMDFQIRRTANVASSLSPSELAPTTLPKAFPYASGLLLALAALLAWNPTWLEHAKASAWLHAAGASSQEEAASSADAESEIAQEQSALEKVDQALERLRQRELELPESLRDLKEAQEALAESRMEMEQLQMDLEKMGAKLESAAGMAELAAAMKSHDAKEVADLLRALSERLGDTQTSEELKALLQALRTADVKQVDLKDLMRQLENAQGELSPERLQEMAKALQEAANQLEEAGQQMAAQQQPLDSQGQEQSLQAGTGQQQAPGQQQMGQPQQGSGQAVQSASGMMSSQLQMAQFQGDPSNAVPVDAGPAGDSTGPGSGKEPVPGEATSLDVQLQLEALKSDKPKEEPIPEEIFERLSREEKSVLDYRAVIQRGKYAEENALSHQPVPWPYRSLVKQYFLSILESSEPKQESSSQK